MLKDHECMGNPNSYLTSNVLGVITSPPPPPLTHTMCVCSRTGFFIYFVVNLMIRDMFDPTISVSRAPVSSKILKFLLIENEYCIICDVYRNIDICKVQGILGTAWVIRMDLLQLSHITYFHLFLLLF